LVAAAVAGQVVGRALAYHEVVGSTNDIARDLGTAGEAEGLVVVADTQTAGRGRIGKSPWVTPPRTSLAASVLLRPVLVPARLSLLAMLGGVASVEAIAEGAGLGVALKWPNDVVAGQRKLGGVLVESVLTGERVQFAVLGIGINVNLRASALGPLPDAAMPPTSLLDETGRQESRERLLVALLRALERHYACVRTGNFTPIVSGYRARLATLGQHVRVRIDSHLVEGRAIELDDDGSLVVLTARGRERLAYGEVTLRS
jgi:BirA family biotin operon repressor/biotin-[acetyl-CoA-carboxylase] ligase